jgi:hypothetical protein
VVSTDASFITFMKLRLEFVVEGQFKAPSATIPEALASLVAPTLENAQWHAARANCVSNLRQIGSGLMMYSTTFTNLYPRAGPKFRYNLSERDGGGKVNLGPLYPDPLADGRIFYCRAMRGIFSYDNPEYGFVYYPDDYSVMAYIYAVHAANGEYLRRQEQDGRQAMVSDNVIRYLGGDWGTGHYCHVTGYNVLRADNSVDWYADPDESIAWSKIHSGTERLLEVWDAFTRDVPD